MRLFGYYVFHTFVNSIKKLFRTWVIWVIVAALGFGVIAGLGAGMFITVLEEQGVVDSEEEAATEELEAELEEEISKEDLALFMEVADFAIAMLVIAVLLFMTYTGDKGGTNIFTMADVNLLFPSPRKPQFVLMFKVFLQMGLIVVSGIYLLFQLPNLVLNLDMNLSSALTLIASWIVTFMFGKLFSVLSYTVGATYEKIRKYIKPAIILIALVIVLFYGVQIRQNMAVPQLCYVYYIPIWGQLTGFAVAGVHGMWLKFALNGALLVIELVILLRIIWSIQADFYEDAFINADTNRQKLEDAKQGMTAKKRSKRVKREEVTQKNVFGEGAMVFFKKSVYNRRRFAKFGIFTNTSLTYLGIGIVCAILDVKVTQLHSLLIMGIILTVFAYFRNYGNPLALECRTHYLQMVPEKPFIKIFYSMMAGCYDTLFDLLPAFVVTTVVIQANPAEAVLWVLFITCLDFLASGTGLVLTMIFPVSLNENIVTTIQMFLKFLVLLPAGIFMIFSGVLGGMEAAMISACICNAALGILMVFVSSGFLHNGRN